MTSEEAIPMDDYATMERRLVARLLKYWRSLGGGLGRAAAYSDIEHTKIGQEWDWCFVLDCRDDAGDPTLLHVGNGLIADFEDDPTDHTVSELVSSNLLGKALSQGDTDGSRETNKPTLPARARWRNAEMSAGSGGCRAISSSAGRGTRRRSSM